MFVFFENIMFKITSTAELAIVDFLSVLSFCNYLVDEKGASSTKEAPPWNAQ